jgi:hypothetical protein
MKNVQFKMKESHIDDTVCKELYYFLRERNLLFEDVRGDFPSYEEFKGTVDNENVAMSPAFRNLYNLLKKFINKYYQGNYGSKQHQKILQDIISSFVTITSDAKKQQELDAGAAEADARAAEDEAMSTQQALNVYAKEFGKRLEDSAAANLAGIAMVKKLGKNNFFHVISEFSLNKPAFAKEFENLQLPDFMIGLERYAKEQNFDSEKYMTHDFKLMVNGLIGLLKGEQDLAALTAGTDEVLEDPVEALRKYFRQVSLNPQVATSAVREFAEEAKTGATLPDNLFTDIVERPPLEPDERQMELPLGEEEELDLKDMSPEQAMEALMDKGKYSWSDIKNLARELGLKIRGGRKGTVPKIVEALQGAAAEEVPVETEAPIEPEEAPAEEQLGLPLEEPVVEEEPPVEEPPVEEPPVEEPPVEEPPVEEPPVEEVAPEEPVAEKPAPAPAAEAEVPLEKPVEIPDEAPEPGSVEENNLIVDRTNELLSSVENLTERGKILRLRTVARNLGVEYNRNMSSEELAEEIAIFEVTKGEPVAKPKKKPKRSAEELESSAWKDVGQMTPEEFLQQLYDEEEELDIPREEQALEDIEMGEELASPGSPLGSMPALTKELPSLEQQAPEEKPKKKMGTIRRRGAGRIPGGRKKR